jgi:hypothetical protein
MMSTMSVSKLWIEALGLKTIAFLTLRVGVEIHHILIGSAIIRWAHGRDAGWEILLIDALNQSRLATVMKWCDQVDVSDKPFQSFTDFSEPGWRTVT